MKIAIKLNKSNQDRGNGYEIVVYCNHLRQRKQRVIGYSKIEHFNEEMQLVNEKHPDYDVLMPRLMDLKLKIRKLIATGCVDVTEAIDVLFGVDVDDLCYVEFCQSHITGILKTASDLEKNGDLIARNRITGTANSYKNSINQFKKFFPKLKFSELDYQKIMYFRKHYENVGASKRTISHYLSALKAMYNHGVLKYKLEDKKPFTKTMDNLKLKSFEARKKYITIEDIAKLEKNEPKLKSTVRNVDLFLLQFYFGGCDLTDLYFMKRNSVFKGRIIFERGKTGQMVNLKIHPKAQAILDKYKCSTGEWLFPFDKSVDKYKLFLGYYWVSLGRRQRTLGIDVLPAGGNISVKVARHTFGNRAKQLMIDSDIIRELMGHERDDVDNFYKDKFSEQVRDEALFRIIETENLV